MAKLKAPKAKMLSNTGVFEVDSVLHAFYAKKRLSRERNGTNWQMAAAAASNRRLLIGQCLIFKSPG